MSRYAAVGKETTYGTPVAPTEGLDLVSETLQMSHQTEDLTDQRSGGIRGIVHHGKAGGGEMVLLGNYETLGLLFKLFMGSVTTTGAGPYAHTFPAAAGLGAGRQGVSGTIEVERDDAAAPDQTKTARLAGSKITGFAISSSTEQSPQFTFGVVFKDEAFGTRNGDIVPTFNPMTSADMTITFDAVELDIRQMSLSAAWPVDAPRKQRSKTFHKEPVDAGHMTVEFEVVVDFEDTTQYAKIGSATPVDVAIVITDGLQSLTINLNKCMLVAGNQNLAGRESTVQTLQGRAYFDTTATDSMQLVLVNNDATIP